MIDCSITVNFFKEKERACVSSNCWDCPIGDYCDSGDISSNNIEKAVSNLQEWSDAHPRKTYLEDFMEKYPNALIQNGMPRVCLSSLFNTKIYCDSIDCLECWNQPMEDKNIVSEEKSYIRVARWENDGGICPTYCTNCGNTKNQSSDSFCAFCGAKME